MKKIIKNFYRNIPFKVRFWIDKNIRNKIEEVEIVYNLLRQNKEGIMIDVGAHFGTTLEPFMNLGWTIHAFEPDPNNRKKLIDLVGNNSNVFINTEAVSNVTGLELSFYSSKLSTGISGLSNFHPTHEELTKVITVTLSDYISSRGFDKIDFLKIDTEGHDFFVLQGYDWDSQPNPSVIVCEFEDNKTVPLGYSYEKMGDFLVSKGYYVVMSEWKPIKEYGGSHKWLRLSDYPAKLNVTDSWGNFIAFKDSVMYHKLKNKLN
jgi:FkbM family methyltransferase